MNWKCVIIVFVVLICGCGSLESNTDMAGENYSDVVNYIHELRFRGDAIALVGEKPVNGILYIRIGGELVEPNDRNAIKMARIYLKILSMDSMKGKKLYVIGEHVHSAKNPMGKNWAVYLTMGGRVNMTMREVMADRKLTKADSFLMVPVKCEDYIKDRPGFADACSGSMDVYELAHKLKKVGDDALYMRLLKSEAEWQLINSANVRYDSVLTVEDLRGIHELVGETAANELSDTDITVYGKKCRLGAFEVDVDIKLDGPWDGDNMTPVELVATATVYKVCDEMGVSGRDPYAAYEFRKASDGSGEWVIVDTHWL